MNEMVAKLDDYGKGAWIAVMVLGFVLFWPVGLAILAYLIWSGRMGCGHHGNASQWQSRFSFPGQRPLVSAFWKLQTDDEQTHPP